MRPIDTQVLTEAIFSEIARETLERMRQVKVFLCDVDGILTDGGIYIDGSHEWKRFHVRDGLGLQLLQRSGIRVGWITHRPSQATLQRAKDLGIDLLRQSNQEKVKVVEGLLREIGVEWEQAAYMGDDLVDLGVLRRVGFAATVPEAISEAKQVAHYVTHASAGCGAVREVVELILRAQGKWETFVSEYAQ